MEREPHHLEEDPSLRRPFIEQESLDEFTDKQFPGVNSPDFDDYCIRKGVSAERIRSYVENQWRQTLDRDTSLPEGLYLKGLVDINQRRAVIDQMYAQLREAAVEKGIIDRGSAGSVSESELPEV